MTGSAADPAVIQLSDVEFAYPVAEGFRIRIDQMSVPAGDCIAIVGPSGSGKTTLLGLLAGILVPAHGKVVIDGEDVTAMEDRRRRKFRIRQIGQVFQSFELLHYLNVVENVMLPHFIDPSARRTKDIRQHAMSLLGEVGLKGKAHSRPAELSQGEQQRVAVCRAMLNQPALLLADEPTGNLDQNNKQRVVEMLLDQARRNESTLLMVTHDQSLLGSFSTVLDIRSMVLAGKRGGEPKA